MFYKGTCRGQSVLIPPPHFCLYGAGTKLAQGFYEKITLLLRVDVVIGKNRKKSIFLKKKINFFVKGIGLLKILSTFAIPKETRGNGEVAEWSIAAVLKTVEPRGSGGSNPSLSANKKPEDESLPVFCYMHILTQVSYNSISIYHLFNLVLSG